MPASGTAGTQTWVAPEPAVAVAVDLATVDGVEVQVFADDGDPRLAAAVELLSPRNKDRPAAGRRSRSSVSATCNRAVASWSWTRSPRDELI